jgi:hypothetical protein
LTNLLFREYGIDLPTARKLVIDRNNGNVGLGEPISPMRVLPSTQWDATAAYCAKVSQEPIFPDVRPA